MLNYNIGKNLKVNFNEMINLRLKFCQDKHVIYTMLQN